jgi:hypothetical protein
MESNFSARLREKLKFNIKKMHREKELQELAGEGNYTVLYGAYA